MADIRERDQPGTVPRPRRDGGGRGTRTGSPGGQDAGEDALAWSVAAMSEALHRIGDVSGADVPQAVAAVTEAVWWVTVVDAAITRHCPAAYRGALAALDPAARRAVERSVAGLRFIRGQLGYSADPGDFIQPAPGAPAAAWTWRSVPPPSPQRGTVRDTSPYREYRTQLAGRPLTEALTLTAGFLSRIYTAIGNRRGGTAGQVPSAHIEASRRAMPVQP